MPLSLNLALGALCAWTLAIAPALAEPSVGAAKELERHHRYQAAETMLQELLKRDPDDVQANIRMAYLKDDLLQEEEALGYLKNAADKHPESFEAQVMLIHGYLWVDKDELALRQANRTIRDWSDKQTDPYWKAMLYIGLSGAQGLRAERGGLIAAMKYGLGVRGSLEKALALAPDCALGSYTMGRYCLKAPSMLGGDAAKGLRLIERSIQLSPDDHHFQAFLVRYLYDQHRMDEAREIYARYRETFADNPAALHVLSDIAGKLDR